MTERVTFSQLLILSLAASIFTAVPYAYLLWDESQRYQVPFFEPTVYVLISSIPTGYFLAAIPVYFLQRRGGRRALNWLGISLIGSALIAVEVLTYFYFAKSWVSWRRTTFAFFAITGILSSYSAVFTSAIYYLVISRLKNSSTNRDQESTSGVT